MLLREVLDTVLDLLAHSEYGKISRLKQSYFNRLYETPEQLANRLENLESSMMDVRVYEKREETRQRNLALKRKKRTSKKKCASCKKR